MGGQQLLAIPGDACVVVMDAATRHLPAKDAYQTIYGIVRQALEHGFDFIYKKTDSALRGNIGSELTAVLDASGQKLLPFFPAYPQLNRFTIQGTHYIGSTPVSQSPFGRDPFEPVRTSYIPDIIASQSHAAVYQVGESQEVAAIPSVPTIAVFDSSSPEVMKAKVFQIKDILKKVKIMAGCAGVAEFLPQLLGLHGSFFDAAFQQKPSLVVSGSLNPITLGQIDRAIGAGFIPFDLERKAVLTQYGDRGFRLAVANQIKEKCQCPSPIIIRIADSENPEDISSAQQEALFEADGQQIATNIGALLAALVEIGVDRNLIITGGDVLHSFLGQVKCQELIPLGEVEAGVVYSLLVTGGENVVIVSMSGGFGAADVFIKIEAFLQGKNAAASNGPAPRLQAVLC